MARLNPQTLDPFMKYTAFDKIKIVFLNITLLTVLNLILMVEMKKNTKKNIYIYYLINHPVFGGKCLGNS